MVIDFDGEERIRRVEGFERGAGFVKSAEVSTQTNADQLKLIQERTTRLGTHSVMKDVTAL